MTDLAVCEHCRRTLLSGEHGPGLCGAPSKRPRWFPPHAGEPLEGLPWSLGRTPSDRAKDEARCAAVSALRACGDLWGLDASRLEQAESATTLIARVDVVLEDLHEAARRGRLGLGDAHGALGHLRDLLRPPGRFLFVDPEAVPWRNRAAQDPLAAALVHASGTDAEAADLFAAAHARARSELTKLVSISAVPFSFRVPGIDREALGRLVRETWVAWAKEQPSPKPSWLAPWEALQEPDREVDRRIGEAVARRTIAASPVRLPEEKAENDAGMPPLLGASGQRSDSSAPAPFFGPHSGERYRDLLRSWLAGGRPVSATRAALGDDPVPRPVVCQCRALRWLSELSEDERRFRGPATVSCLGIDEGGCGALPGWACDPNGEKRRKGP